MSGHEQNDGLSRSIVRWCEEEHSTALSDKHLEYLPDEVDRKA